MKLPYELALAKECRIPAPARRQRTLKRSAKYSGVGLFTGAKVTLRISPLGLNRGIVFQRIDLPHRPLFSASLEFVQGTPRCTMVGDQEVSVQTVEHLLAALSAYSIDNALIELTGPEVPISDGSSLSFVELIEDGGVQEQEGFKRFFKLSSPIYWSQGDIHVIALPSEEFRVSYTLHYPNSRLLRAQFYTVQVTPERFKTEIAPCRTFALYEEIIPMIEKGLIKGGSLDNAVVVKDDCVINPEGVRFPEEMARHKILDLIGDLSLVGVPFFAHIIALRSGHTSNIAFARELSHHIKMEMT